jgi:DNA invertase Pin-like site-specific DNA recombinase
VPEIPVRRVGAEGTRANSRRTTEGLATAKARGVTLGNPKIDEARQKATAEIVDRADQRAANVIPIMRQIQRSGATSLRQIAEALNARGISAPRPTRKCAIGAERI